MKKYTFGMTVLALALAAACGLCPATQARPWKPTAKTLAQDYGQIVDNSKNGEVTVLFWFPAPLFDGVPEAQDMAKKYIIIGAVHMLIGPDASMTVAPIDTLQPLDGNGKPLHLLPHDTLPRDVSAFVTVFGAAMSKSLGVVGTGLQYFVFDAGDVDACKKGGFSVPLNGEIYTYDTPIPGCPAP